jgi:hypothetical protein
MLIKSWDDLDKPLIKIMKQVSQKKYLINGKWKILDEIIEQMCVFRSHFELSHHCETIIIANA